MLEEVRKNILEVVVSCDTVQFCTFGLSIYPETMTIANFLNKNKNDTKDLTLHFLTNKHSHKIEQVKNNKNICLYYFNQETRHAMTLFGDVEVILDQTEKQKFWMDDWKSFGYSGKDDKTCCIIQFTPKIYKYYINKSNEQTGEI
mgnify:CR=1 FL=1